MNSSTTAVRPTRETSSLSMATTVYSTREMSSTTMATTSRATTASMASPETLPVQRSLLAWSWALVVYVVLASALLYWRYKRDSERQHEPTRQQQFAKVLAGVLWCSLLLALIGVGVLAATLESADDFDVSATVLLTAVSLTSLGIGVFGTVYQLRVDQRKERAAREREHQEERAAREREQERQRYDYATLFVSMTDRMLSDAKCRSAVLMLTTHSGSDLEFRGERDDHNRGDGVIVRLSTRADGLVHHFDTFELALALDSRNDPDCFWLAHGMTKRFMWAYHNDMEEHVLSFVTWLSFVSEVYAANDVRAKRVAPPPALQRYIDMLLPPSTIVDAHDADRQRRLTLRFVKSLFVWRRLFGSIPRIARALEPFVFVDVCADQRCPSLGWWLDVLMTNLQVKAILDDARFGAAAQPDRNAAIADRSAQTVAVTRRLLEFLWQDRRDNPPPTLAWS